MKIVALGASNSRQSINKKFATYAAGLTGSSSLSILDLNDFEVPLFGVDREKEEGIPQKAYDFKKALNEADGIIISFAEHNGAYSAVFKNIFDWISRIEKNVWHDKPMLLLATSPGGRGGRTVLDIAVTKFGFMNKNVISSFSLPLFNANYSDKDGITEPQLNSDFQAALKSFTTSVEVSTAIIE